MYSTRVFVLGFVLGILGTLLIPLVWVWVQWNACNTTQCRVEQFTYYYKLLT